MNNDFHYFLVLASRLERCCSPALGTVSFCPGFIMLGFDPISAVLA